MHRYYACVLLFLSLTTPVDAALNAVAGSWIDTTGKERSLVQWHKDYDFCQKAADKKLPSKEIKPGPIGNYYGNAIMHVRFVHTYILFDCMPKRGWHWTGS